MGSSDRGGPNWPRVILDIDGDGNYLCRLCLRRNGRSDATASMLSQRLGLN